MTNRDFLVRFITDCVIRSDDSGLMTEIVIPDKWLDQPYGTSDGKMLEWHFPTKMFLSLDDAVHVAVKQFDVDATIARQEFEQKCYVTDDQYTIGFYDGLDRASAAIRKVREDS